MYKIREPASRNRECLGVKRRRWDSRSALQHYRSHFVQSFFQKIRLEQESQVSCQWLAVRKIQLTLVAEVLRNSRHHRRNAIFCELTWIHSTISLRILFRLLSGFDSALLSVTAAIRCLCAQV